MTLIPWSCSAHAKDIWTTPDWEKREKLGDLDWLVTCTAAGHAHLQSLSTDPARVALVYHGLDFTRFPEPPARIAGARAKILSVGRLVPKKGYPTLLLALSWGGTHYPWSSPPIFGLIAGSALLWFCFAWRLRTAAEPLIPLAPPALLPPDMFCSFFGAYLPVTSAVQPPSKLASTLTAQAEVTNERCFEAFTP